VTDHQIWLDPGFGFAKSPPHNLEVLKQLNRIVALGYPVLLGTSRKSTVGLVLDAPTHDRLEGTGATVVWGSSRAAHGAGPRRGRDVAFRANGRCDQVRPCLETMTSDTLTLSRLHFFAHHGILPEETARGQDFEVTVHLELPLAEPAAPTISAGRLITGGSRSRTQRHGRSTPETRGGARGGSGTEILRVFPLVQAVGVEVVKPKPPVDFVSTGLVCESGARGPERHEIVRPLRRACHDVASFFVEVGFFVAPSLRLAKSPVRDRRHVRPRQQPRNVNTRVDP